MNLPDDISVVESSGFWTWMGKDGIARSKVKPLANIAIKEAKENSNAVISLYAGKSFPLLIDSSLIKSMSKEARDFLATKNRRPFVNAFVILVETPLSKVIGNFFMGLNKPEVPAKLFSKEEDAIRWLTKYTLHEKKRIAL